MNRIITSAIVAAATLVCTASPALADDEYTTDTVAPSWTAASAESCADPEVSPLLASFKDDGLYAPAPGGSFENGASGWLLEHFWWGSVFLPALPVMGLLLAVGPRLLPEYRDPEAGRLDLVSLSVGTMPALELAAPGQPLAPEEQLRRARHSRRAAAALDYRDIRVPPQYLAGQAQLARNLKREAEMAAALRV